DKLSLCIVDDGMTRREVVCGAPNVALGIVAPFARVGATLPDGTVIAAAELRSVTSDGMLCSARELGLSDDAAGLLILDDDAPLGQSLRDYLKLDDAVLDIDITPNRGDCFSVVGIAREIAAKRNVPLRPPEVDPVSAATADTHGIELRAGADCP